MHNLHAGNRLGERPLHLAILYLRWVQYLLEQSSFFHPLVDADCRARQQKDETVKVGGVDDFLDGLSGGRRIQRCLVIAGT